VCTDNPAFQSANDKIIAEWKKEQVMAKKHDRHDLHVVPATVPEDLLNRQPTVEELFTQTIYDAVAGWLDAHTAELIVAVADAVADRPPPAQGL
jgi:hypothetical protein